MVMNKYGYNCLAILKDLVSHYPYLYLSLKVSHNPSSFFLSVAYSQANLVITRVTVVAVVDTFSSIYL